MHDEACTHYVSMIENTAFGHRFLKEEFDYVPTVGWQIDPFGHSATQVCVCTHMCVTCVCVCVHVCVLGVCVCVHMCVTCVCVHICVCDMCVCVHTYVFD